MPLSRRCLLAAPLLVALGCGKAPEQPHGSPVLLEVYWEVKGAPTRVWARDADAAVVTTVPPQGSRVDFVFDRRLDGARIEDTVDDMPAPKTNPPIHASWPDMDTVMSDPPFAANVFYNSIGDWGPGTTYAFLTPMRAGFPAATPITFTLDPSGLTSVYGEPMDGPTTIVVNTGPFAITLPNNGATAPTSYRVPIVFSTRAPRADALWPFIHVLAGVNPLTFELKNDNGDSTLLYIIPLGCGGMWPADTEITIFADQGLPDAFGKPLAVPVAGRFKTAALGSGCPADAGAGDAPPSDAGAPDGGMDDGGPPDDAAPQSN